MTGDGFSQAGGVIKVGYLAGIRWFEVANGPACGRIATIGRKSEPVTLTCSCGESIQPHGSGPPTASQWVMEHADPRSRPVLCGARAQWKPGENTATCLGGLGYGACHQPPGRGCGCGFWAYWALSSKTGISGANAAGIIKGYGDYRRGERGFRCSHAKITALFIPYTNPDAANAIETRYQVPVYGDIDLMIRKHPAPAGQPALRDAYYVNRVTAEDVAAAFKAGAHNCLRCGVTNCAPGQGLCASCAYFSATGHI